VLGSVFSKNGKNIRLTSERWSHIVESHDYMAGNQDIMLETVENPDLIVDGIVKSRKSLTAVIPAKAGIQ